MRFSVFSPDSVPAASPQRIQRDSQHGQDERAARCGTLSPSHTACSATDVCAWVSPPSGDGAVSLLTAPCSLPLAITARGSEEAPARCFRESHDPQRSSSRQSMGVTVCGSRRSGPLSCCDSNRLW